jgi:hypothetical protein
MAIIAEDPRLCYTYHKIVASRNRWLYLREVTRFVPKNLTGLRKSHTTGTTAKPVRFIAEESNEKIHDFH